MVRIYTFISIASYFVIFSCICVLAFPVTGRYAYIILFLMESPFYLFFLLFTFYVHDFELLMKMSMKMTQLARFCSTYLCLCIFYFLSSASL